MKRKNGTHTAEGINCWALKCMRLETDIRFRNGQEMSFEGGDEGAESVGKLRKVGEDINKAIGDCS